MQNRLGSPDPEAGAVGVLTWQTRTVLGTNDVWHLFLCLALGVPSLDKCLLKSLVHFSLNYLSLWLRYKSSLF